MKRGIRKTQSFGGPLGQNSASANYAPTAHCRSSAYLYPPSQPLDATSDTTSVYSLDPYIVRADIRMPCSAYFLYLPTAAKPEMVYIDNLEGVKKVASWSIWRRPAPACSRSCFRINRAPGKGLGMFATRTIKAGELVCAERPVYASRTGLQTAYDQTRANGDFQHNALLHLSDSACASLLALRNSHRSFPGEATDAVVGTLLTNSLPIDITEKPDAHPDNAFSGCFPTLSRANHSCTPNANYFFSFPTFCGQFWAVRDIAEGEEITVSYATLTDTCAARQSFLARRFCFTCTCDACVLPPALLLESDRRRDALGSLLAEITEAHPACCMPIARLKEGLKWAEKEGLAAHYAGLLLHGSGVVLTHHGADLAAQWAKKARDAFRIVEGPGSYNVKDLDRLTETYRTMAAKHLARRDLIRTTT